ncbi:GHKL domain-containing protein [Coprococcus sp. AM25-15LB]|nr:GHKL domain-containing protein [Clostridiales bacterium]RGC75445.1 GHKL domain-containing protein [Coprococcus sp. AM25-15LB]RJW09479.1 GHKL domain-containing protein [Coprococcus sp. AM25-4LB]
MQILPYVLCVFSYLLPIYCFLPFKLKLKQIIVLSTILLINILLIGFVLGNMGVILLIISTCVYIASLNPNRIINICVFIATYLFCVLWDNLFSLVWDIFIYPVADLQSHLTYYIVYIISYILLLACICPILGRLLYLVIHRIHTGLSKQLLLLITTNLLTCLFIFLFNIAIGDYIGYSRSVITFNCILFACYFIISTILIVNIIKSHMEKVNLDIRQDSYNRLQEYTNQIENMYSSLRSFKHDYSNIMLSMSGYIEANDMDGLKEYFDKEILPLSKKITKNTAHINQLMNIKTTELKSIISSKLLYAIELNINVNIEVTDEIVSLPIDTLDLCRVIGIFLDNAIEATLETDQPSIRFALINLETEYIFVISNTFLEKGIPYAALAKPNVSTKGANRGIGLYNAHEIISRYNHAFLDTEIQDKIFVQRLQLSKSLI